MHSRPIFMKNIKRKNPCSSITELKGSQLCLLILDELGEVGRLLS